MIERRKNAHRYVYVQRQKKEGNNKEERFEALFLLLSSHDVVPHMKLDWNALENVKCETNRIVLRGNDNNKDENKSMYILQKNN